MGGLAKSKFLRMSEPFSNVMMLLIRTPAIGLPGFVVPLVNVA